LRTRVLDFVGWVGDGAADAPVVGLGTARARAARSAVKVKQRQEQEGDAAHALVGGADGQRVGQGPDADAAPGEVAWTRLRTSRSLRPMRTRVGTTMVPPASLGDMLPDNVSYHATTRVPATAT